MSMFKLIIKLISILGISFLVSCDSVNSSSSNAKSYGLGVGSHFPELKLESNNNSKISTSSLKGSIVLVDFWASWCAPCRKENKFLVKLYDKYKDAKFENGQGFKIFSVSLDGSGDPSNRDTHYNLWNKAIQDDLLNWPYHVSDLKGWTSPLIDDYNIDAIPASYLINGDGEVLAKDLRGDELERYLIKILDI